LVGTSRFPLAAAQKALVWFDRIDGSCGSGLVGWTAIKHCCSEARLSDKPLSQPVHQCAVGHHRCSSRIAQVRLLVCPQTVAEALAYADRVPRLGARCI
jgi:hypothetical protein